MARRRTRNDPNDDQNVLFHAQKGLPSLAVELLLQIVSHMQGPVIPWYGDCIMPNEDRERREGLRALCRLCRSLRSALLPFLWERLEACTGHDSWTLGRRADDPVSKLLEQEVIGQFNLITFPYASYVRVVNVAIETRFSSKALSKLSRAMTLMLNLHTVQIICSQYMLATCKIDRFEKAFKNHVYPSVRRVSLPHQATSILASFPGIVDVYINQPINNSQFRKFLQAVALHCPKVECFGWQSTFGVEINMIPQILPNLRRLEHAFLDLFNINKLLDLPKFKSLEKFTLSIERYKGIIILAHEKDPIPESLAIEVARKVLAGSVSPKKQLVLDYYGQIRVEILDEE